MMKRSYDKKICDYVEAHQQELVTLLQECVRIPSVTGNEGPVQEWMESRFREMNLEIKSFEADYNIVSKHPAFIDSGISFKGRPNVIGIWKGNESAPSLTINGHCDVVSPEPVAAWTKEPWGAEIEDGRLYGRGSLDMKGGFIAGMFAVKTLQALDLKPVGTVILESVIEEEAGAGGGTLACMLQQCILSDAFIALEPQGPRITYCHAGVLYFRINVQGKTMHAGMAHEGVNAIGKILKIYEALVELNNQRHREISFEPFEIGSGKATNLNVGTLKAGDWPSSVAGFAVMECRIGFVPGETETGIREMIETLVSKVADEDEWMREHRPTVEWFGWHAEPWYQDPGAEYPQSFRQTMKRYYGREPVFMGRGSGNDARFTSYFRGQGICSGCTGGGQHGIDEYVDLISVINTTKLIAMNILDWCGLEGYNR
jgi:acetylornithine deacetylase